MNNNNFCAVLIGVFPKHAVNIRNLLLMNQNSMNIKLTSATYNKFILHFYALILDGNIKCSHNKNINAVSLWICKNSHNFYLITDPNLIKNFNNSLFIHINLILTLLRIILFYTKMKINYTKIVDVIEMVA